MFISPLFPFVFYGVNVLLLFVFVYVYWSPTRLQCQMIFVSFDSNTTGASGEAGTAYLSGESEFTPVVEVGFVLLSRKFSV